jgi:hypothetical protein
MAERTADDGAIRPTGVNLQTELDPTQNPSGVQLQGVTVH